MKFSELDLHPMLLSAVEKQNFIDCTPIQEQVIPLIVRGKDVAGLAQTGTGKTAAFILPLMDRILKGKEKLETPLQEDAPVISPGGSNGFNQWLKTNYILILVPTRELAEQVYETVQSLGSMAELRGTAIYGGMAYDKQKKAISHGVEFVVATPGRFIDLYKEHVVDLRQVRAVVFDEADRMFDMGFKDDMKYILHRIPRDRQLLVFSATLNFDVLNVCYEFGSEPVEINVSKDQPKAENVEDKIFHVGVNEKPAYLLSTLKKESPRQAIIFSNFKRNVEKITQFLNKNGFPAVGISSLMTQSQRQRVMTQFKSENERNILVATDLAARGLDVAEVDIVVNFELPDDPENYVHRIGRTGRAGAKGRAFSLVSDRDLDALKRIEGYMGHKISGDWLEDSFLLKEFSPFPLERELAPYPALSKERGGNTGKRRPSKSFASKEESQRRGPRSSSERRNQTTTNNSQERKQKEFTNVNGQQKKNRPSSSSSSSSSSLTSSSHRRPPLDKKERGQKGGVGVHHSKRSTVKRGSSSRGASAPYRPLPSSGGSSASSSSTKTKSSLGNKVSRFFKKIFGGS